MKRRSGIKRCSAGAHSPQCRPGRPLCRWRREPTRCYCSSIRFPHRRASNAGKHGCCEKHIEHAHHMWALMETPIRKVR